MLALPRRRRRRALARAPGDRARRREALVLTVALGRGEPARVRVPHAHARALHVPRRSSASRRSSSSGRCGSRTPRSRRSSCSTSGTRSRSSTRQCTSRRFHFEPWFDWIFGGFATTRGRRSVWSLAVAAIAVVVAAGHGVRRRGSGAAVASRAGPPRTPARTARPPIEPEATARAGRRSASSGWRASSAWSSCAARRRPAQNLNDSAFHLQMVRWAERADPRGPRAARRLVPGPLARLVVLPPLPEPPAHAHRVRRARHRREATRPPTSGSSTCCSRCGRSGLPRRAAARLGPMDGGARPPPSRRSIVSAPGYGYEHGSYTWQGYGVYSQLWAMWLLPIAWGLTWRAVTRGRSYAAAAVALALTMALPLHHRLSRGATVGVWVLVPRPAGFLRRAGRAAVVGRRRAARSRRGCSCRSSATRSGRRRASSTRARSSTTRTARARCSRWLFTGELFDDGRFPVVTLLFARRRRRVRAARRGAISRARALLGAFALSLLSSSAGRPGAALLDLLPGFGDIQIHRFVMGVHLAGILIAGVGLAWLVRAARQTLRRLSPAELCRRRASAWLALVVRRRARARVDRARPLRRARRRRRSARSGRTTRPTGATSTGSSRSSRRAAAAASTRAARQLGAAVHGRLRARARLARRPRRRRDRLHVPHDRVALDRRRGALRRDQPGAVPDAQHPLPDPARRPASRRCPRSCSRAAAATASTR